MNIIVDTKFMGVKNTTVDEFYETYGKYSGENDKVAFILKEAERMGYTVTFVNERCQCAGFSPSDYVRSGAVVYKTKDGNEVVVTQVFPTKKAFDVYKERRPDIIYMGEVGEYVRGGLLTLGSWFKGF
jgi:hypothetical protein